MEEDKSIRPFHSTALPRPREMVEFSLPTGPLDVEIGAGTGIFAIEYARSHADRHLIAIEHTGERFRKFRANLAEIEAIPNLTPVHANAISWLSYQLAASSVDTFFFMYPNPNPKKKHQNKRWHAMPFMQKVIELLKPEGEIYLATNEQWYFDEARDFFARVWKLEEIEVISYTLNDLPFSKPRTLFEKKYLERGESCFQLRLKKERPSDEGAG